jgi:hypothetical protein
MLIATAAIAIRFFVVTCSFPNSFAQLTNRT